MQKPFLVLDNHTAHQSREPRDLLEQFFVLKFFPPYPPMFNSIETLFGLLKPRFKFMLAENDEVETKEDLTRVLWQTIESFTPETMQRVQTANMRYLRMLVADQ